MPLHPPEVAPHVSFPDFGIENYRSFGTPGVFFSELKKFNVFVGRNNCGKSNVLRFLEAMSRKAGDGTFTPALDAHFPDRGSPLLGIRWKVADLTQSPRILRSFPGGDVNTIEVWVKCDRSWSVERVALPPVGPDALIQLYNALSEVKWATSPSDEVLKRSLGSLLAAKGVNRFSAALKQFVYVPDIRRLHHIDEAGQPSPHRLDGRNVIAQLHEMQHPLVGDDNKQRLFVMIERFVRDLLDTDDLRMEVSHDQTQLIVTMHGRRLPLDSFGTGIHELVILCSALAMHNNYVVCMEEPELHLHPSLQRRFLNFIKKNKQHLSSYHSLKCTDGHFSRHFHHTHCTRRQAKHRPCRQCPGIV